MLAATVWTLQAGGFGVQDSSHILRGFLACLGLKSPRWHVATHYLAWHRRPLPRGLCPVYKLSTSLEYQCGAWMIPRRVDRRLLPGSIGPSLWGREGGAYVGSFCTCSPALQTESASFWCLFPWIWVDREWVKAAICRASLRDAKCHS